MKHGNFFAITFFCGVFFLSMKPQQCQAVTLDDFSDDYLDGAAQSRLGAAYGYSVFGPDAVSQGGGMWEIFCDDKGSTIADGDGHVIRPDSISALMVNNSLQAIFSTEKSLEQYPSAGMQIRFPGEKGTYYDLSNLRSLDIRAKGAGFISVAFVTKDIVETDNTGFYECGIQLSDTFKTYSINVQDLKPGIWTTAGSQKWTWDHGKGAVCGITFSIPIYSTVPMTVSSLELIGVSEADFHFAAKVPPVQPVRLRLVSSLSSPAIKLEGDGFYTPGKQIVIQASAPDRLYRFKRWIVSGGNAVIDDSHAEKTVVTLKSAATITCQYLFIGPAHGPCGMLLDNTSVAEHAPGAVVGAITVVAKHPGRYKFVVDDPQFECGNGVLKLKDGVSVDYHRRDTRPVHITAYDTRTHLHVTQGFKITVVNQKMPNNIRFTGLRSSDYGVSPFPTPWEWKNAFDNMNEPFPNA
ncbi:MAG: hypothetical protein JW795_08260, partial [Chitinivibrionales bacterium]|nr:hypothetical protein [Chitinivibrionales bacterium]